MDTLAAKDKNGSAIGGASFDGNATLMRRALAKQNSAGSSSGASTITDSFAAGAATTQQRSTLRRNVDSGYSTCDGGAGYDAAAKWSPTSIHISNTATPTELVSSSSPLPLCLSPTNIVVPSSLYQQQQQHHLSDRYDASGGGASHHSTAASSSSGGDSDSKRSLSNDASPDGGDYSPENRPTLGNVQTYREYKEALRQQRNADTSSIYKPKEHANAADGSPDYKSSSSSSLSSTPGDAFPSNIHHTNSPSKSSAPSSLSNSPLHHLQPAAAAASSLSLPHRKPVLKVTPSRNVNQSSSLSSNPTHLNGNNHKTVEITTTVTKEYSVYMKPSSPTKVSGSARTVANGNNNAPAAAKSPR